MATKNQEREPNRSAGHARAEKRHLEERPRRPKSDQPKAGDRHWTLRGPQIRREGSAKELTEPRPGIEDRKTAPLPFPTECADVA